MNKSILLLIAFAGMLSATLFSCTGQVNNAKKDLKNTNEENREIDQINQEYLKDIEYYRKETAKTIDSNSINIAAFKANLDTEKEARNYNDRQSILELELYNSYRKKNSMIINLKERKTGAYLKRNLNNRWMSWAKNFQSLSRENKK